ncbi:MAG: SH3 domain-containing protein [Thermomicrobiales bacterium]
MPRSPLAFVRLMLVLLILATAIGPIPATAASATVTAGSLVNVRACARLDCDVIGNAELGATLNVTGAATNGFLPVAWQGVTGYVYANFLDRGSDDPWFREGDVSCNRVALIFNIGIGYTPSQSVISTLLQKNAAATMFPMGWWANVQPDYLRQLDAAGFAIGTHGDQRVTLTSLSDAGVRKEMIDSKAAIEAVLGHPIDEIMTPYAAETDLRVRRIVAGLGLLPVGWGVAAADYDTTATEQYVYARVMNGIYPGAVVEFHLDGPATATSTARALPRIIDALRAQGYDLSTVPDLMTACSPPVMPTWPTTGTVTGTGGDGLRCRANPSLGGAILGQLAEGQRVTLRGKIFNGWYPLTCGSQPGWASASYLQATPVTTPVTTPPPTASPTRTPTSPPTTPPPSPSPTTTPNAQVAIVTGTGGTSLRCRTGPGTSYAIITDMPEGTRVTVRGATSAGWIPIRCVNRDGWASADYLTLSSTPAPSPTSPPTTPTATVVPTQSPTSPAIAYARVGDTGGLGLNCRSAASTSGTVIVVVSEGTRIELRGPASGGWAPVRCGGRDGWMSSAWLIIPG